MVELEYVDAVSYETVRRVLKKTPWKKQQWVIPPKQNGEFVARMEQVLDVYKRPYDPRHPVVCMDARQLIRETPPLAAAGRRHATTSNTNVAGCATMAVEPLASKRTVQIREGEPKRIGHTFSTTLPGPTPAPKRLPSSI